MDLIKIYLIYFLELLEEKFCHGFQVDLIVDSIVLFCLFFFFNRYQGVVIVFE